MSKKVGLFLCPKGGGYANGIQNATLAKIDEAGEKLQNIGSSVENVGKKFLPVTAAASSIVTRPFLTSLTNIRMKAEKRLNGGGFRFWRCCRSTRAFVRIFLQETRTNIANEVVYHGERLRLFWQRQYRICPL